ncbi:MAG: HAMP domain-containing protein [Coleofasciculaceae cyanobacterium SM2_1_6]|nr:HAMP domain-containing protein [Coleofasciculaceae cyanobacterium SM2_1_6]
MASGKNFTHTYGLAEKAYMQGDYTSAASIIDELVQEYPEDPSAALLRGHIYCYGLQQYDIAQVQYQAVLDLQPSQDFLDYANNGLEYAISAANGSFDDSGSYGEGSFEEENLNGTGYEAAYGADQDLGSEDLLADFDQSGSGEFDQSFAAPDAYSQDYGGSGLDSFDLDGEDLGMGEMQDDPFANFQDAEVTNFVIPNSTGSANLASPDSPFGDIADLHDFPDDPFSLPGNEEETFGMPKIPGDDIYDSFPDSPAELGSNQNFDGGEADYSETFLMDSSSGSRRANSSPANAFSGMEDNYNSSDNGLFGIEDELDEPMEGGFYPEVEEETLLMSGEDFSGNFNSYSQGFSRSADSGSAPTYGQQNDDYALGDNGYNRGFGLDDMSGDISGDISGEAIASDFLEEFDVFGADDDLSAISNFDLEDQDSLSSEPNSMAFGYVSSGGRSGSFSDQDISGGSSKIGSEEEIFSIGGSEEQLPTFAMETSGAESPLVTVDQGLMAPMENAPLQKKQWIIAATTGVVSAVAVAIVSFGAASTAPPEGKDVVVPHLRLTGGLMTLAAGAASFGTAWFLGRVTSQQIRRSTDNLQTQFEAVSQGNLNVTATVFSEDEFGKLAAGFNQMARVILTTTSEAQRKAVEQEQAKEDLQRQVIRLLDDVEGAARGDLTVQAEVTADVLGAVADSFNLTIQNLREIVQQVTRAARQVTKGANDNESFARSLSSDALRQAEELAVTLNSVKVMTDSIQRVAESAREAEEVARTASTTALKGGEAVERTVAGILQIRETVAETTRKVKRLAESSQEISKIVAAISAIASRTNLLALNASIEAARAGEAGKGFAIVADEVRQLADRSAKSLREIEQIVLQIQSETSSVMTAMEEGVTQVIEGTKRAEQAKRALEDIIQVSNRIDALVRSITADTVEQTLTSRAVTQVMQSVELTAQETSQEAQRVSGSLQSLVSVARDLLTSVERFRIEAPDGK